MSSQMYFKKITTAVVSAVIAVSLFGCSGNTETFKRIDITADNSGLLIAEEQAISGGTEQQILDSFPEEIRDAAFVVNGEPVDAGVMKFAVNDYGMRYARSLMLTGAIGEGADFDWNAKDPNYEGSYLEYTKFWALEELIPRYALVAEGKRRGINLTAEEKQQAVDWCKEMQGTKSDKEFQKTLAESGCPDKETFIAYRQLSMLEAKVYEDFKKNPEKYASREQLLGADERELVTVKHILIAFDPQNTGAAVTDKMKADAKKRAEEVLAKVRAGVEFDNLIEEYNDDPGATDEGYTFANDGTMVQEFTDASFALKVGEVSGLVETNYGYHIIKRLERNVTITDYQILLNKNAKITVNRSVFDKLKITVDVNKYFNNVLNGMGGK